MTITKRSQALLPGSLEKFPSHFPDKQFVEQEVVGRQNKTLKKETL